MKRLLPAIGIAIVFLILGYVFGALGALNNLQGIGFVLAGLALGLVLGFILDWLIEEFYRRNRELERRLQEGQQTRMQAALPTTATGDESHPVVSATLTDLLRQKDDERNALRLELDAAEEKMLALQKRFNAYMKTHPDDLTVIKGIGPVFQRKLRDMGIDSFQQLADLDPEHLHRVLDIKNWQRVNIEDWVAQAKDWVKISALDVNRQNVSTPNTQT